MSVVTESQKYFVVVEFLPPSSVKPISFIKLNVTELNNIAIHIFIDFFFSYSLKMWIYLTEKSNNTYHLYMCTYEI